MPTPIANSRLQGPPQHGDTEQWDATVGNWVLAPGPVGATGPQGPQGPAGPTGPQGPPGTVDQGLSSATDLNTLTVSGAYAATNIITNYPPFPSGILLVEVQNVAGGSYIQQRATFVNNPAYIATREWTGAWAGWHSPAVGNLISFTGPSSTISGIGSTSQTLFTSPAINVANGRHYILNVNIGYSQVTSAGIARGGVIFNPGTGNATLDFSLYYFNTGTAVAPGTYYQWSNVAFTGTATGTISITLSALTTAGSLTIAANQIGANVVDMGV